MQYFDSRTELSKLYQNQDRIPEAEKVLRECLAIDASDPNSLLELGKISSEDCPTVTVKRSSFFAGY